MSRTLSAWARLLGAAGVLVVLTWRLGAGPFLDGLRSVDVRSLVAATGIAALTTMCCAWRWTLVARALGLELQFGAAVTAYYRSMFLNSTLPFGVVGDVHRGVRHGRDGGDLGLGLRGVVWERCAGQVVQGSLTIVLLLLLASPVRSTMPVVAAALLATVLGAVALGRTLPRTGSSRGAGALRTAASDVRHGLLAPTVWPGIVLASVAVVLGHTATFLIAARTAGSTASPARMVPLALLVLLAMALPTNVGGWGPREGVAAWVFALAGLGAAQGLATATVYGVMAMVAGLPGAGVLVAAWLRRNTRAETPPAAPGPRAMATAAPKPTATAVPVSIATAAPKRIDSGQWRQPATASPEGVTRG